MIRQVTNEALELIEHFEGFYSRPYKCPAGVWTIGIGSTASPDGKKISKDTPAISKNTARAWLNHELSEKADTVHRFLERNSILLNDQQYSALVSFAYNCGCGPIIDAGRSLNEAIKSDNIVKIADTILLYDKVTKKVLGFKKTVPLAGLTRRRKSERHLFLNGVNKFYE